MGGYVYSLDSFLYIIFELEVQGPKWLYIEQYIYRCSAIENKIKSFFL